MLAQRIPARRPAPSADVIAYAPIGNADLATIFRYSRIKRQLCLEAAMAGLAAALIALLLTSFNGASIIIGLTAFACGAGIRITMDRWLAARFKRPLNTLLLVDGLASHTVEGATILDVSAQGLEPSTANAAWLNRIGHLFKHCDRVVIDAAPERRALWLEALQGVDVEIATLDRITSTGGLPLRARAAKRAFDLGVTLLSLPLILPVLAIVALLIKLETPGPVLFRQWRVGRCNRQFEILKFRTMRHGAIDLLGHQSARPEDERTTRVGRFLRRTSLDELPQMFNVLLGEMSLVGPRPHPVGCRAEGQLHWDIDPAYARRHAVKPGLTGLAQVRGLRGATHLKSDLTERLKADLEYIANRSFNADLIILIRTIAVVVHPNAY